MKTLYHKYPGKWAAVDIKNIKPFHWHFKTNFKYNQWFAFIGLGIIVIHKDNCNFYFGIGFINYLCLHFHW